MRLFEIITDRILNSKVMEMALEKSRCIDKIRDLSFPLSIHLIKYYAFDDQAKNHWLTEINSYLIQINHYRIKPNSKKLKAEVYYQLLWDEPLNNGVKFIDDTLYTLQGDQYSTCKRSSLSSHEIYEKCEKILHRLSYDIANGKFTGIRNYQDLL